MVMEYVEGGDCATLIHKGGPLLFDLARWVPDSLCYVLNIKVFSGYVLTEKIFASELKYSDRKSFIIVRCELFWKQFHK